MSALQEVVPIPVDMNAPQTDHALCSLGRPAHSREFQSVVDEISTCPFNGSAADVLPLFQADLIAYVLAVAFEISDHLAEVVTGRSGRLALGEHLLEFSDHSPGLSLEKHSQTFDDELSSVQAALVVKKQCCFSHVFHHVRDVRARKRLWENMHTR